MTTGKPLWGPFTYDPVTSDPAEHRAQLRSLATLIHTHRAHGQMPTDKLTLTLRKAEFCTDYLDQARQQFDLLPSLTQRHIIASFHEINHGLPTRAARDIKKGTNPAGDHHVAQASS